MSGRVAAVDCGTHSTRLLVAEGAPPLRIVERILTITRLGAGVDATGRLDAAALERTLACIDGYARRWRQLGATRIRIAATSAIRDAVDRSRFLNGVFERTGVNAEVLSGDEEGRVAFAGSTARVDGVAPCLVVDIGGGSTEFIRGEHVPDVVRSRQLGCVRLTERVLRGDPPSAAEVQQARAVVDDHIDAVLGDIPPSTVRTLVGVAGTVTTVAALHLRLPTYLPDAIHGTRVPAAAVSEITARLLAMPSSARAQLGPVVPGREQVIHGGALILERILQRYGMAEMLVSESDSLDGLALSLLDDPSTATAPDRRA